jgi:hypothetical protein
MAFRVGARRGPFELQRQPAGAAGVLADRAGRGAAGLADEFSRRTDGGTPVAQACLGRHRCERPPSPPPNL